MNWVFEHLQLLIVVGGAIAYWLNQRNKAKEAGGEGDDEETQERRMPPLTAENADAMEQAERTRRIQEEIRRKIMERMGGGAPQPPVEVPPVLPPVLPREAAAPQPVASRSERREEAEPQEDAYAQPTAEQSEAADQAVLDRQARLAEKLRELEAQRREHAGRAETFAENTATAMAFSDKAKKGSLLADLRDPVAARRAIVMREVLGPPVGLR